MVLATFLERSQKKQQLNYYYRNFFKKSIFNSGVEGLTDMG
jgi:uncharacterized protein (DUF608 family)